LYTGISSGPNARYRIYEAFTFSLLQGVPYILDGGVATCFRRDELWNL